MKSTAILAIAASVLSVASAQAPVAPVASKVLSFGAPIAATTWTAGQDATVSWSNTCEDLAPATTFPVQLVVQRPTDATIQDPVAGANNLGEIDCAKAGSITFKVPTTIPSGNKYSIWVARPPSDPKADPKSSYSYSALFTINNAAMPAANTTTTAPVAPTGAPATGSVTAKPIVTPTGSATSTAGTPKSTSGAGAIKAGSVAALAVAGAVAALMF